jgi:hypothetical protein
MIAVFHSPGCAPVGRTGRRPIREFLPAIAAVAALAIASPARALIITPSYTANVNILPNAAQVKSAVNFAINEYQSIFSDPITLRITIDASPGTSILGESLSNLASTSYSQVRTALIADATTATDASVVANLSAANPTGNGTFFIPRAEAQALGLATGGTAGTFTFGAGQSYTFDPNNRAVAGEFDFIGLAEHEISEVMGRISGLGQDFGTGPAWLPNDLLRYTSAGTPSLNQTDTGVYFSIDGGRTNLHNFNPPGNGGDLSDWASGQGADAFNAFASRGTALLLSQTDITQLDAIGYDYNGNLLNTPEPPSLVMALIAISSALMLGLRRRVGQTFLSACRRTGFPA